MGLPIPNPLGPCFRAWFFPFHYGLDLLPKLREELLQTLRTNPVRLLRRLYALGPAPRAFKLMGIQHSAFPPGEIGNPAAGGECC